MNKARVYLVAKPHEPIMVGWITFYSGSILDVSYEDCLGTMLPKFYYPAEPPPDKPAYQVPADAIEKVEAGEEAIARWEALYAMRELRRARERTAEDIEAVAVMHAKLDKLCSCGHTRIKHRDNTMFDSNCTECPCGIFLDEETAAALEQASKNSTAALAELGDTRFVEGEPKPNGTLATLDAITAAELHAAYARGGR